MSLTAKQIEELNAAAARKEAGKASATDVQNLDYATKTFNYKYVSPVAKAAGISGVGLGVKDNTLGTASLAGASQMLNPSQSTGKQVGGGSGGGGGASWGAGNYTSPTVSPMKNVIDTAKATTSPEVETIKEYTQANTPEAVTEAINKEQDTTIALGLTDEEPEVRGVKTIMDDISKAVLPTEALPQAPDFTALLNQYRMQYGVLGLENQLNELRAAEEELVASKRIRSANEMGKTVGMNVIEGRVNEVERQENERIDAVQRQIKNITNQLNTKYDVINTLMQTEATDYNTAVENYDRKMEQNITLFNAAKGIQEEEKDELQRFRDTASSNAEILINTWNEKGVSYDQLTDADKAMLSKLSLQSGKGASYYQSLAQANSGKTVLTEIDNEEAGTTTVVNTDGTTKTIVTRPKTVGQVMELSKQILGDQKIVMDAIAKITGGDGKVDPKKMIALRNDIATNRPTLLSWFDKTYPPSKVLNEQNYPRTVASNKWETVASEVDGGTRLPSEPKGEEGKAATTKANYEKEVRDTVAKFVKEVTGSDGKVNPAEMFQLRQDVAENAPDLLTWFDKAYEPKNLLNPKYYPFGIEDNSWATAMQEDENKKK